MQVRAEIAEVSYRLWRQGPVWDEVLDMCSVEGEQNRVLLSTNSEGTEFVWL